MKKKLRVVVIGCGAIGQRRHLPEYAMRQDVEIAGVVDINLKRAKEAAAAFHAGEAMKDYKLALKKLRPDAVSVCTPNYLHAEMTIAALRCGAHVLCEKPMAGSVAEARAMIAAAKAARRQLMIGHNQRFNAAHVRGKAIYRSGVLGKCLGFSTSFAHGGPESWSMDGVNGFFFKKPQAIIGALGDLGVHKIDLIRWFLDEEVVLAGAITDTLDKQRCTVDDTAFAVLRMSGGAIGHMFAGWMLKAGENNATTVYCQKGVIKMYENPDWPLVVLEQGGDRQFVDCGRMQTNVAGGQTKSWVIDEFVDAIQTGRRVAVPGEEGARSLAAVLACVESARTRRLVRPARI